MLPARELANWARILEVELGEQPGGYPASWHWSEERRGAAELLAALAHWEIVYLRRAAMCTGGPGQPGFAMTIWAEAMVRYGGI